MFFMDAALPFESSCAVDIFVCRMTDSEAAGYYILILLNYFLIKRWSDSFPRILQCSVRRCMTSPCEGRVSDYTAS